MMSVRRWTLAALALAGSLAARPAAAQGGALIARADSLLLAGRVFSAESLYYVAVRRDSRDPAARLALGRYLAQRGALKVGAVLMEEARYFGGDATQVAVDLAPVYERLGEYNHVVALPSGAVSYGERQRAEYLRDHPPALAGPDSAAVPYQPSDSELLGRVLLRIGADTVWATIDARVTGLVLDTAWARRTGIRHFGARAARPREISAVTPLVELGPYTLTNVSTRFDAQRGASRATIGIDLLGRFAPSFDPRARRILLRASGRIPEGFPGLRIATLTNARGVQVVKGETVFPLGHPDVQRYLRNSRWTLDPRRGDVVVDSVGPATTL